MARIRSIKPTFAGDSKVARLSLQARLTFLLLLPEADDEGRMVGSSKRMAGLLYPNDDKIGAVQIERWIAELRREEMVITYAVDGTTYLAVRNFRKHQNPQHPTPSVLPPPPNPSGDTPERLTKSSRSSREPITKPSSLSVEGVERERELSSSYEAHESVTKRLATPPAVAEEEEFQDRMTTAVRLVAERRLAVREGPPITNATAWLRSVRAEIITDHGDELRSLAAQGLPPKAMAERIMPVSTSTPIHEKWEPRTPDEPALDAEANRRRLAEMTAAVGRKVG